MKILKLQLYYVFILMSLGFTTTGRAVTTASEVFSLKQDPVEIVDRSWPPPYKTTVHESYYRITNFPNGVIINERHDRSTTSIAGYLTSSDRPLNFDNYNYSSYNYNLNPQLISEITQDKSAPSIKAESKQAFNLNYPISTSADWIRNHFSIPVGLGSGEASFSSSVKEPVWIPTEEDKKRGREIFMKVLDQRFGTNSSNESSSAPPQELSDTAKQVHALSQASKNGYSFTQHHLSELSKFYNNSETSKQVSDLHKATSNGFNYAHQDHRLSDVPIRNQYVDNNPSALDKQQGTGSCKSIHQTLRTPVFENKMEELLLNSCLEQPKNRSVDCVHIISKQAAAAFSNEQDCKDRVTANKLMCIFNREVKINSEGQFNNDCVTNGCGMAQITGKDGGGGVEVVRRATVIYKLDRSFDSFWDMLGIPEMKKKKCTLRREDALDRNTSIIMAATHLCAQAKHSPRASSQFLSCEYQMGLQKCTVNRGNTDYSREIESCEKKNQWPLTLANYDILTRASCVANNNCNPIKKSGVFFQDSHSIYGPTDEYKPAGAQ